MNARSRKNAVNRREFLSQTGSGLVAAALPVAGAWHTASESARDSEGSPTRSSFAAGAKRRIPIGVFDPVYDHLALDEMLDKVSTRGLEAMEIGTGGYPQNRHCPLDDLIQDKTKAKAWQKKFEDKGIRVATLSCHGNPVHPNAQHAQKDVDTFRKTVLLAEMLDIKVIVGFSGCPGGTPTDTQPNWITYRWPPEYNEMLEWQWKEKVVPYWKDAAKRMGQFPSLTDPLPETRLEWDALLAYATLSLIATKSSVIASILGSMAAAIACENEGNLPVAPADVRSWG